METNHYKIISNSIRGERAADEQVLASVAILAGRLEDLKRLDSAFEDIEFSPHVKRLKRRAPALAAR